MRQAACYPGADTYLMGAVPVAVVAAAHGAHLLWRATVGLPTNGQGGSTPQSLDEMTDPALREGNLWDQCLYDLIIGGYQRRHHAGKMTGEWIIFAKSGSMDYYLTLALHSGSDEIIFERIRSCIPDLSQVRLSTERGGET